MYKIKDILNQVIYGDTRKILQKIPNDSIDCCITSPPYWGQRDYGTEPQIWDEDKNCQHEWGYQIISKLRTGVGPSADVGSNINECQPRKINQGCYCKFCDAWNGSLGLEPAFELYLKHLWQIFDEVKRVLKKTGTLWVNIGDTYAGMKVGNTQGVYANRIDKSKSYANTNSFIKPKSSVSDKCLCQIPSRFSIGMTDKGWILRNEIIWYKKNSMPSSAKDRFTVDFEKLFFFVKNKKYYFETQYEPFDVNSTRWGGNIMKVPKNRKQQQGLSEALSSEERPWRNSRGRNKRCVWDIPTRPLKKAHLAVFPPKLCITPIKAGCPQGGVILDLFAGSGTVGVVAKELGRNYILIDLSPEYCKMAEKRLLNTTGSLF